MRNGTFYPHLLHRVGADGGHGEVLEALPRYGRDEVEVVGAVETVLHVLLVAHPRMTSTQKKG